MRRRRESCINNIPAEYVQVVPLSHLMMKGRSEHQGGHNTTLPSLCTLHCSSSSLALGEWEMLVLVIFPPTLTSVLHRPAALPVDPRYVGSITMLTAGLVGPIRE